MPLPERIANAPELQVGLELFYTAFLELSSCRTVGFGEGPIPWLAIQRYCEVAGVEGYQREDLFYHIQRLDEVYLGWRTKQQEAKTKGAGRGPNRSKRVR